MHWKFVIIIFFLASFDLGAQPYQSIFGTTSTSWNQLYENFPGTGTDSIVPLDTLIIDSISYKEVIYYDLTPTPSSPVVRGFIREDTANGKVWYASVDDTLEWLSMDLSLGIGDSFWLNATFEWQVGYYIVDSVFFKSTRKHVRLDVPLHSPDSTGEKLTFIEGIGTNAGITYQDYHYISNFPFLLCAHKDGAITYNNTNPELNGLCIYYAPTIGINDSERNSFAFKIFPNPAFESLTIRTDATYEKPLFVEIVDQLGRSLVRKRLMKKHVVLDISLFASGIYSMIVSYEDNLKIGTISFVKR